MRSLMRVGYTPQLQHASAEHERCRNWLRQNAFGMEPDVRHRIVRQLAISSRPSADAQVQQMYA